MARSPPGRSRCDQIYWRIFNVDYHIDCLAECLANGPEDELFAATRSTNVPAVDLACLHSRLSELANVVKSELKRLNESSHAQIARSSSVDVANAIVAASNASASFRR